MVRANAKALTILALVTLTACGGNTTSSDIPTPEVTVTVTEPAATDAPDDGGSGDVVTDPCDSLPADADQLAFVFVSTPRPAQVVSSPLSLTGCSNTFEATYQWRLLDGDGNVLVEGFGTATCGTGCVGTFEQEIEFSVGAQQVGSLEVFTASAEDGSVQDLNVIPLLLQP